jgi:hypothetical protein
LYNRWHASDCLPGIEPFGTRLKSRQAANSAPNMSAFSVQKRPLSASDVQTRALYLYGFLRKPTNSMAGGRRDIIWISIAEGLDTNY